MKKQTINPRGMSIEDIMRIDTRTIKNEADLRALATRLASAANKRVRRLAADPVGRFSPPVQAAAKRKDGKLFSTRGLKTRKEIKTEFDRIRAFLDPSKTSHTVKGWRETVDRMTKKHGVSKETVESPEFWRHFREFHDEMVPGKYTSDSLTAAIETAMDTNVREDLLPYYLDYGQDEDLWYHFERLYDKFVPARYSAEMLADGIQEAMQEGIRRGTEMSDEEIEAYLDGTYEEKKQGPGEDLFEGVTPGEFDGYDGT